MTVAPTRAVKLFGTDAPPAETRILTAGPLSVELDAGNLRYIRYAGQEAIRAISYVVRDQFWGTFNPVIEDFQVEERDEGFTVTYSATCRNETQAFRYRARIVGEANGDLRFEADGTALEDFLTNRTGFVVLHAVEGVSGAPVTVDEVDGRTVETVFPDLIDPKQPIMNIRALTHAVAPGLKVVCTMNGDTFEMEDQRNWTDASYKTYVRPLGLPHPYTIASGEELTQSVTLSFQGAAGSGAAAAESVSVALGDAEGKMPEFGMALEAQHVEAALARSEQIAALQPKFLSCFFDARRGDGAAVMRGFKAIGDLLPGDLALEVVIPGQAAIHDELADVARMAEEAGVSFSSVAATTAAELGFVIPGTVFPDSKDFDVLFAATRAAFPGAKVGGGNFVYFTELNRKPPPFEQLDYVSHGTSALVHAADDRSVTETIECLPYIIKSARALFGDRHYRISPAGIGSRTSPFGNEPTPNPDAERVTMTRADPRQRSLLGAAWHLGYAARAAAGGVDSVVLGAPVGEFGLIHHPMAYTQPWYDDAGGLYPAFHVMRALYAASGAVCRAATVSQPRDLQALAIERAAGCDLWLANLTGEAQTVEITGLDLVDARIARIDEDSFEACAGDSRGFTQSEAALGPEVASGGTVSLQAYATVRIRT